MLPESYMRAKPAAEALRKAPMKVLEERIRYNVYRSENNAATDDIEWKQGNRIGIYKNYKDLGIIKSTWS